MNNSKRKSIPIVIVVLVVLSFFFGDDKTDNKEDDYSKNSAINQEQVNVQNDVSKEQVASNVDEASIQRAKEEALEREKQESEESNQQEVVGKQDQDQQDQDQQDQGQQNEFLYNGKSYTIISVDGGDQSGSRQANCAVDIGFGDREYWGLTNDYGQLVYVLADEIILQNDKTEPVNENGRYYDDEAYVPGTEKADLDQGHVIADSLGGVSNAYNITPQNSTLNRHGDQAYMEKVIRDAGGCENFVATISYGNTSTQTPTSYKFEYKLNGYDVVDEFANVNPDVQPEVQPEQSKQQPDQVEVVKPEQPETQPEQPIVEDIAHIDTNGNGQVTIKEAKAAGFKMPITSDHWLYKYMHDGDGDGQVGE